MRVVYLDNHHGTAGNITTAASHHSQEQQRQHNNPPLARERASWVHAASICADVGRCGIPVFFSFRLASLFLLLHTTYFVYLVVLLVFRDFFVGLARRRSCTVIRQPPVLCSSTTTAECYCDCCCCTHVIFYTVSVVLSCRCVRGTILDGNLRTVWSFCSWTNAYCLNLPYLYVLASYSSPSLQHSASALRALSTTLGDSRASHIVGAAL